MKKPFYLMLLLATMLTFTACSNDKNALSGTTWSASYGSTIFIIEFEDNNRVSGFNADANGNIRGNIYYGNYSSSGNNIVFDNFSIAYYDLRFYFTNGTISGNYMSLNYYEKYDDGTRFDHQMKFRKK